MDANRPVWFAGWPLCLWMTEDVCTKGDLFQLQSGQFAIKEYETRSANLSIGWVSRIDQHVAPILFQICPILGPNCRSIFHVGPTLVPLDLEVDRHWASTEIGTRCTLGLGWLLCQRWLHHDTLRKLRAERGPDDHLHNPWCFSPVGSYSRYDTFFEWTVPTEPILVNRDYDTNLLSRMNHQV